jgi:hypothetical protein
MLVDGSPGGPDLGSVLGASPTDPTGPPGPVTGTRQ